jgi:cyclic pyranopterin phosphate synthase
VKITGGEPLIHPDIVEIVRFFASIESINDVSMTTNGLLLEKMAHDLKRAGLNRVNIGCDSVSNPKYKNLRSIQKGIDAALDAGLLPIKLNMVLMKSVNEEDVEKLIEIASQHGIILQIIELINTNDAFFHQYHLSLDALEKSLEKRALKIVTRKTQDRKQFHLDSNSKSIVELVSPVHNPKFCANCHTCRITNDFQFQTCLHREDNLVPILGQDNVELALLESLKRREPYHV